MTVHTSTEQTVFNTTPSEDFLNKAIEPKAHIRGRIIWKVQSLNPEIASVRYRCLTPIKYLNKLGVRSNVYTQADMINLAQDVACIVFVKSFTVDDLQYAYGAHSRGIPVVMDLCDNIFFKVENSGSKEEALLAGQASIVFREMAKIASCITTTTQELAEVIKSIVPDVKQIQIIPDPIEEDSDYEFARQFRKREILNRMKSDGFFWFFAVTMPRLSAFGLSLLIKAQNRGIVFCAKVFGHFYIKLVRILARVSRTAIGRAYLDAAAIKDHQSPAEAVLTEPKVQSKTHDLPQVLWFGNAGSKGIFGITDILGISEELVAASKAKPFQLTVVSNSEAAFKRYIQPLDLPTKYVSWSHEALAKEFTRTSVVIVPNPLNQFSSCKSANRTILALRNRVPVVATPTSALKLFGDCIGLGDFRFNLLRYLESPTQAARDLKVANEIIDREFNGLVTAKRWLALINKVLLGQQQNH
jgi:hypothetical protein